MSSDETVHQPGDGVEIPASSFHVASIMGHFTGRGLVELTLGAEKAQVVPAKAREIATFLLEAASAAEGDEILSKVLERTGMRRMQVAQVLQAQRHARAEIVRHARAEMRAALLVDQAEADVAGGPHTETRPSRSLPAEDERVSGVSDESTPTFAPDEHQEWWTGHKQNCLTCPRSSARGVR
jgi:hypothetical protein